MSGLSSNEECAAYAQYIMGHSKGGRGVPIEELGLRSRTYNGLYRIGLHTVDDVLHVSEEDLLSIPGFGRKSLADLKQALRAYGYGAELRDNQTVNIRRSVATLCRKFGFEPRFVKSIYLTPTAATVVIYEKNSEGAKFIADNGWAATEVHRISVKA